LYFYYFSCYKNLTLSLECSIQVIQCYVLVLCSGASSSCNTQLLCCAKCS